MFGVVHYEQDPPVFGPLEAASVKKFRALGGGAKIIRSYILDLNSLATQARDIVGELKRAGVTTVVFLGDPLMPKFLSEQAAAQDYHPEWTITGTVFTDATTVGRLYDQTEWAHAFGASSRGGPGQARGRQHLAHLQVVVRPRPGGQEDHDHLRAGGAGLLHRPAGRRAPTCTPRPSPAACSATR